MSHDADVSPEDLYKNAVGDASEIADKPKGKPDVVGSNSSNYGGSALDDSQIEERVLRDD